MNKEKKFQNYSLWWLDISILNLNNVRFKYSLLSNSYILSISEVYFYFFFLLNKKNLNTLNFYILDILTFNVKGTHSYYVNYQSLFFDFKILIETFFTKHAVSLSKVYFGSLWIERETKEFNQLNYTNLTDTRKLLLNYNYNSSLNYNNYNNILNDLNI